MRGWAQFWIHLARSSSSCHQLALPLRISRPSVICEFVKSPLTSALTHQLAHCTILGEFLPCSGPQCLSVWAFGTPHTGWLKSKHLFLTVLEVGSLRSGCQCGWVLGERLLAGLWTSVSLYPHTREKDHPFRSFVRDYKTHSLDLFYSQGSTHMTQSSPKGP